jgi:hypothetical protein
MHWNTHPSRSTSLSRKIVCGGRHGARFGAHGLDADLAGRRTGALRLSEVIMPVGAIIAVVIVFILVAAAAALAATLILRMVRLRHQFGPEYNRLVSEVGTRRAQAELANRQRRVAGLGLRPLTAEQRARYNGEWTAAQERFVDSPSQSVDAASQLVSTVLTDRGYQVGDQTQLIKDLSVHHARSLDGYRRARKATEQAGTAQTEQLRQALLGYRELFTDLFAATSAVDAQPLAPPSPTVPGSTGRQSPPAEEPVIRGTVLTRARTGRSPAAATGSGTATSAASAGRPVAAGKFTRRTNPASTSNE